MPNFVLITSPEPPSFPAAQFREGGRESVTGQLVDRLRAVEDLVRQLKADRQTMQKSIGLIASPAGVEAFVASGVHPTYSAGLAAAPAHERFCAFAIARLKVLNAVEAYVTDGASRIRLLGCELAILRESIETNLQQISEHGLLASPPLTETARNVLMDLHASSRRFNQILHIIDGVNRFDLTSRHLAALTNAINALDVIEKLTEYIAQRLPVLTALVDPLCRPEANLIEGQLFSESLRGHLVRAGVPLPQADTAHLILTSGLVEIWNGHAVYEAVPIGIIRSRITASLQRSSAKKPNTSQFSQALNTLLEAGLVDRTVYRGSQEWILKLDPSHGNFPLAMAVVMQHRSAARSEGYTDPVRPMVPRIFPNTQDRETKLRNLLRLVKPALVALRNLPGPDESARLPRDMNGETAAATLASAKRLPAHLSRVVLEAVETWWKDLVTRAGKPMPKEVRHLLPDPSSWMLYEWTKKLVNCNLSRSGRQRIVDDWPAIRAIADRHFTKALCQFHESAAGLNALLSLSSVQLPSWASVTHSQVVLDVAWLAASRSDRVRAETELTDLLTNLERQLIAFKCGRLAPLEGSHST